MKKLLVVAALGLLVGVVAVVASADRSDPLAGEPGQHLLLDVVQYPDGRFEVLHRTVVHSGLPRQRGLGEVRPWRFALIADGRVLHEAAMEDPAVIRGEFQDTDDPNRIDAVRVRQSGPVHFAVRVPLLHREAELEFHALRSGIPRPAVVRPEAYRPLGRVAVMPPAGE